MKTRTRIARYATAVATAGLIGAAALVGAPASHADASNVVASPSNWTVGSSPEMTVTFTATGSADDSTGFGVYINTGWLLTQESYGDTGTLSGNTLTCPSGVTITSSAGFTGTQGSVNDACWSVNGPDIYFSMRENDVDLITPTTVTVHVPAGLLVATAPGTSLWVAYAYTDGSAVYEPFYLTASPYFDGPPPSYLQQVPLPATGSCSDVVDTGLDWNTGLTGGWTKAWGEWANDGTGGWVCQRTITYSPKLNTWVTE